MKGDRDLELNGPSGVITALYNSPVYIGFQLAMQRIIPEPLTVHHHDSAMSWDSMVSAVEASVPRLESLLTDGQSLRDSCTFALCLRSCSPLNNLSMSFVYTENHSANKAVCTKSSCDIRLALSSIGNNDLPKI